MNFRTYTILLCICLASCGGKSTFHEYARAGDTVAIPVGMQPNLSKDNITVTITPSVGDVITLLATDPSIRAVINLYPDPVSNMLVSRGISENTSPGSLDYAYTAGVSANDDKDWYQTTVFLDLPSSLPDGLTQIVVSNGLGSSHTSTMEVIPGNGTPHGFKTTYNDGLPLNPDIMASLARANHNTVNIDSTNEIPHALEISLTHDTDVNLCGSCEPFVINPLGYLKNISWSDDGPDMKVIIMQSKNGIIDNVNDFKFYIAGTATNLALNTVKGFDSNGQEINGITATLE